MAPQKSPAEKRNPVAGWWKERKHLEGWKKDARYSLVVSLETASEKADFYTEIEQKIKPAIKIET